MRLPHLMILVEKIEDAENVEGCAMKLDVNAGRFRDSLTSGDFTDALRYLHRTLYFTLLCADLLLTIGEKNGVNELARNALNELEGTP